MIEFHSLILLHFNQSLVDVRLVGWFMHSPQGDVVSRYIDDRLRLNSLYIGNWIGEYTYLHVLCRTSITEFHYFISTYSDTAWLGFKASLHAQPLEILLDSR